MLPLKDIFSLLASGEFSNMAIAKDAQGNIDEAEYGKIINHINLALIELYKRFKLLEEELVLCADPAVLTYRLRPEYMAAPGSTTLARYIEQPADSDGTINIIEIKDVFDEDNQRIQLNNRYFLPAIKQKSVDTLKITGLIAPQKFSVVYQAYPSLIKLTNSFDLNLYQLAIPPTIVEPLLFYVASRVYKPIGANNSTANADKSASYEQKYELACQKLTLFGLETDDNDQDMDRFTNQGWV